MGEASRSIYDLRIDKLVRQLQQRKLTAIEAIGQCIEVTNEYYRPQIQQLHEILEECAKDINELHGNSFKLLDYVTTMNSDKKREAEILRSFLIMHGLEYEYENHWYRMMSSILKSKKDAGLKRRDTCIPSGSKTKKPPR